MMTQDLVIEDQKTRAEMALSNLTETCRSKATKAAYIKGLKYYMRFIGLPVFLLLVFVVTQNIGESYC
jgi:hypothetical protein